MRRENVGELVNEVAGCVRRVVAVDPMYQGNAGYEIGDRALDFLSNMPWSGKRDRERTFADLVAACAIDPHQSDAPTRLGQAVADGYMGEKMAWHALGLAAGGFPPDFVVAYVGGMKSGLITDGNARESAPPATDANARVTKNDFPITTAHAYLPDAETAPENPVSRVAMTLLVESETDWKACYAEVSRIIDLGDAASQWDIDLAILLAAAMEEFERRDTRTAGGQTTMPLLRPRQDTNRELLERAIAHAPLVTEEQKRRLRLLADGPNRDESVTE